MKHLILPVTALMITACSTPKEQAVASSSEMTPLSAVKPVGKRSPHAVVAMTRIYKTNGDYADRVPVTLDRQSGQLISFPAPSDLRDAGPLKLSDGYLLDRRGVSAGTAFTRWTYAEYSALPEAPSLSEIKANLINGARVTEIYEMPFAVGSPDAAALCDSLISAGLPGCKLIYKQPVISQYGC